MPTNAINDTGVKYLYDKLHGEIEPVAEAVSDNEVTIEGNPLNFNTLSSQNAKSTILSVEPIQDLHGYSKPWVGGAGKNILPLLLSDIKARNTDGTWSGNTYTENNIHWTVNTDSDDNITSIVANGTSTASSQLLIPLNNKISDGNYYYSGCPDGSSSGSIFNAYCWDVTKNQRARKWDGTSQSTGVGWRDDYQEIQIIQNDDIEIRCRVMGNKTVSNIVFLPMICFADATNPAQFEPYTNFCSISGRTSAYLRDYDSNLIGALEQGSFDSHGVSTSNSARVRSADFIQVTPNSKIKAFVDNGLQFAISVFDSDNTSTNTRLLDTGVKESGYELTIPNNGNYIKLVFKKSDNSNLTPSEVINPLVVNSNGLATDITFDFGQTVYGGVLDAESGVLTIDTGYIEYDGSVDEEWQIDSGGRPYIAFNGVKPVESNSSVVHAISNEFRTLSRNGVVNSDSAFGYTTSKNWIFKNVEGTASVSDWQTYLSNNPVEIVYELETPTTIQLTPHAISILKGVNNFSTDGDKITLTYREGEFATLGDLEAAKDEINVKIAESQILTDTVTGTKYRIIVSNGVLDVEEIV